MICIQLLVCRVVVEISIVNVRLHIFNNFLVIWEKVALHESDIVHSWLKILEIQYSRTRSILKIVSRNCRAVAEFNTVFSNI